MLWKEKSTTAVIRGVDSVADADGRYCYVPTTHKATLGEIVDLLEGFKNQPKSLLMPEITERLFCEEIIFDVLVLSSEGGSLFSVEDERR